MRRRKGCGQEPQALRLRDPHHWSRRREEYYLESMKIPERSGELYGIDRRATEHKVMGEDQNLHVLTLRLTRNCVRKSDLKRNRLLAKVGCVTDRVSSDVFITIRSGSQITGR